MPLYEYRCRNCNHQFEIQQSFSDDALTVCPECEGELRKVFNPVGISFKGSGFYKNDSRGGSSSSSSSSDSSSSSSSDDSGSTSSTTKEPASTSSSSTTSSSSSD
ncbi:MAG: FmdB family zinc ribbon protein [Microthrixaceae bacterium]